MAFVVVTEERGLTRTTTHLSMTQSALSRTVCHIKERLGLRLPIQTIHGVIPTEAGEHLLSIPNPMLHNISSALTSLSDLQNCPSGIIRITTVEYAAETILLSAMHTFLKSHPEIDTQLTIDYGLTDVVSGHFDVGVRLGGEVDRDMIAIQIGPNIPTATVGLPDYLSRRGVPTSMPQLINYRTTNLYLPTSGTASRWRLTRGEREIHVRMEGQPLLNTIDLIIDTVIDGHGLAYLPYDQVEWAIRERKLIRILDEFTPDLPGCHLYYPHRRHVGSAFSLFIDRLKYKGAV